MLPDRLLPCPLILLKLLHFGTIHMIHDLIGLPLLERNPEASVGILFVVCLILVVFNADEIGVDGCGGGERERETRALMVAVLGMVLKVQDLLDSDLVSLIFFPLLFLRLSQTRRRRTKTITKRRAERENEPKKERNTRPKTRKTNLSILNPNPTNPPHNPHPTPPNSYSPRTAPAA